MVFREEDERFIPVELRRFNRYRVDTSGNYQVLLRWLREKPQIVAPPVEQGPDLPPAPASGLFVTRPDEPPISAVDSVPESLPGRSIPTPATRATSTSDMPQNAGPPLPLGVILDRRYAYALTEYSNDLQQQTSAELLQKYEELFDVLTCSILLFDQIYIEQHHVSFMLSKLNDKEKEAFFNVFTSFSLSEPVGSPLENLAIENSIRLDLDDLDLRPIIASYYGRRSVRGENRELIFYVNRVLQHAKAMGAAIFVLAKRMPLFRYKLRGNTQENISLLIPSRKCRSLDQLATLRLDPIGEIFRTRVWQEVQRRIGKQTCDAAASVPEVLNVSEIFASQSDFLRRVRLEVSRQSTETGTHSWFFLIADIG